MNQDVFLLSLNSEEWETLEAPVLTVYSEKGEEYYDVSSMITFSGVGYKLEGRGVNSATVLTSFHPLK